MRLGTLLFLVLALGVMMGIARDEVGRVALIVFITGLGMVVSGTTAIMALFQTLGALGYARGLADHAEAVFATVEPVFAAYARQVTLMGAAGAGQTTKMCNQIAIAGQAQGVAEAINFAQRAGLDIDRLVDTISKGAAASWYLEHRGRTMAAGEFDFGFAIEWMRKDLAICLEEANRIGARLPVTALVDQFYAQLVERGHPRWDTSSLVDLLQNP